jgi:LysR family transcriptional regulator, hydrogen peroxide-inducible genes activator
MEMQEVRYFLAMSRTLNFTKAAGECHVSQPALTRAIRKMEDELGGLLFSREPNNTHMTQLGRLVEPHLTEIMAQADEAKQTASRFLKLEGARLSVGTMCTIAPVPFVNFLDRFRADNPGIEITLLEGMPDQLCALLAKGELDVGLMARPDGFPAPLQASKLYSERFVIACSAGHRFAMENEIRMADLDGEFYLPRINCEFYDVLDDLCREHGAKLVKSYQSEREDWILTMVAAGMGVCFLPEYTAVYPGVVSCPVVSPSVERDVCLITVAGRRWSSPVAAFVQAVRRYSWTSVIGAKFANGRPPLLSPVV